MGSSYAIFSFILNRVYSKGKNFLTKKQFCPIKVDHIMERFVIQESKQEITKVVSLYKMAANRQVNPYTLWHIPAEHIETLGPKVIKVFSCSTEIFSAQKC